MKGTELQAMTETQMMERVNLARFPQDLTIQDKRLLAQVAISYGFDPLMGEVSIYQGRPYVSIDGRYRKAQETGNLDGVLTKPATKQEKEDWQIPDSDFFCRAEVYCKEASHPFVGWGRVRLAETQGGKGFKPVETNPQRMAEKRAESQALRKAFHIPLPSVEDIGTEEVDETLKTSMVIKDEEIGTEVTDTINEIPGGRIVAEERPEPAQPKKGEALDLAKEKTRLYQELMQILQLDGQMNRANATAWICQATGCKALANISPEQMFDALQVAKKQFGNV